MIAPACAKEGTYTSGPVSPEYQYYCCEGLKEFNTKPGMVGNGWLCYDPKKGEPKCISTGSKSDGWYYPNGGLLAYDFCGTNTEPCVCTMEYAPVCGTNGKTYGNACQAKCDNMDVSYKGECTTSCPTQESLDKQAAECKLQNKVPIYYMNMGTNCQYVKCGDAVCKDSWELETEISKCKEAQGDYSIIEKQYSSIVCKEVECKFPTTPECPSLEKQIAECKAKGMDYVIANVAPTTTGVEIIAKKPYPQVCPVVKCIEPPAKCDATALEKQIKQCKEKGWDYTTYAGADGCKYAKCIGDPVPKTVECKKYTDVMPAPNCPISNTNGKAATDCITTFGMKVCTIVSCTDGYEYNSCKAEELCQKVQCYTMTDEKGCNTTKCTDGSGTTSCPEKPPVDCKVVQLENGCEEKRCTDGYVAQSCSTIDVNTTITTPTQPQPVCMEYVDEKGCKVKSCENGAESRVCATVNQSVECKTFTDDKNCKVKECTNGYTVNSCDIATCKTAVDTASGCKITSCANGTVKKDCPTTAAVECKKYTDEKGCTIKTCTDGYNDKVCPTSTDPTASLEQRIKALEQTTQKQQGLIEQILAIFGIK